MAITIGGCFKIKRKFSFSNDVAINLCSVNFLKPQENGWMDQLTLTPPKTQPEILVYTSNEITTAHIDFHCV